MLVIANGRGYKQFCWLECLFKFGRSGKNDSGMFPGWKRELEGMTFRIVFIL